MWCKKKILKNQPLAADLHRHYLMYNNLYNRSSNYQDENYLIHHSLNTAVFRRWILLNDIRQRQIKFALLIQLILFLLLIIPIKKETKNLKNKIRIELISYLKSLKNLRSAGNSFILLGEPIAKNCLVK